MCIGSREAAMGDGRNVLTASVKGAGGGWPFRCLRPKA